MEEKTSEKLAKGMSVIVVGWLQKVSETERISKRGDLYFSMVLEISEINEINSDNSLRNFFVQSPINLIFWKNVLDEEVYNMIAKFKVGQNLTVRGLLRKTPDFERAMLNVKEVETSSELFIA